MKLIFAQANIKESVKQVLRVTFDITKRELGLSDADPTIVLLNIEPPDLLSFLSKVVSLGGTEKAVDEDGFIRVTLTDQPCPHCMAEIFSHELVHVCQTVTGTLKGVVGTHEAVWRGQDYHDMVKAAMSDFATYEQLPWEKQAREMADKIFPLVEAEFARRWPILD